MLPNGYPFNLNQIYDCWKRVIKENEDLNNCPYIDPSVLRSWEKCKHALPPDSKPSSYDESNADSILNKRSSQVLINDSVTFLEDCHQYMENTKSILALTDGKARFLYAIGDHDMLAHAETLGLKRGLCWDEATAGTNAIALSLENAMPTQVIGAEHYFSSLHSFATTAAPVHDIRGRIIGVVSLFTPVQDASQHALPMIMTISQAIENHIHTQYYLNEANARRIEVDTVLSSINEGIIAWDSSGRITHMNTKASEMTHLSVNSVKGEFVDTILHLPDVIVDAWESGSVLKDVETSLSAGIRNISILASLVPYQTDKRHIRGFILTLKSIAEVRQLVNRQSGTQALIQFAEIPGKSADMKRVIKQARAAANNDMPILIRGDEGVGRIQLAQAIHNESERSKKPFLAINCNAIPGSLMASEILGEGSSSKSPGRPSKFELADGGTLLLDRIETLTIEMQSALVHLIETGTVMRLKSDEPVPVDVRIIGVTSADLEKMVAEGAFNRRLYYALFIFSIYIPPLKDRPEDLRHAVAIYLERQGRQKKKKLKIEDETISVLQRYYWPGNFRELENALELASEQCSNGVITVKDLPVAVVSGRLYEVKTDTSQHKALSVMEAEKEAIYRAGWITAGRVSEMANILGISRTTLWRRLKEMKISIKQFKR